MDGVRWKLVSRIVIAISLVSLSEKYFTFNEK